MKELKAGVITKRITGIVSRSKFLRDPKYYKNNKTSVAAWDSWAARGQAGGCACCGVSHYNCTVYNKRNVATRSSWSWIPVSPNLCTECYQELIKQVKYTFTTY